MYAKFLSLPKHIREGALKKPGHGNSACDRELKLIVVCYYLEECLDAEKLPTGLSGKKRAAIKHELVWSLGADNGRPGLFDVCPDLAGTCPYRACTIADTNRIILVSTYKMDYGRER